LTNNRVWRKGVVVFEATYTKRSRCASFGEARTCEGEFDNASDKYTVAVIGKSIPDVEIGFVSGVWATKIFIFLTKSVIA
jgi:hypothetical protein